jgi:hypothetical protein
VGSGLWEGGRCQFRNPRFTYLPEFDDGQTPLLLVDLDTEDGVIEDQRFSLGRRKDDGTVRWEASEDGASVARVDGEKPKINDRTGLGRVLKSLVELEGAQDILAAEFQAGRFTDPHHAAFYDGLDVTLEAKSEGFTNRQTNETATQNFYVVTEFHGYDGGEKAAAKPASGAKKATAKKAAASTAKKAAGSTKKAASTPAPVEESGPDAAVLAKIREVADTSDDVAQFVARCYDEITEVQDDPATYGPIVEDVDNPDGIWGQAYAAWEAANAG